MAIRIVRLGTPRLSQEGVRIGTVRRPPRGVRKERYAAENYFDVWLPNLAPSVALIASYRDKDSPLAWKRFAAKYASEMGQPDNKRLLDTLAALSRAANFSVGCYCEDES